MRRLYPARDNALPLYVSQLVLCGNVGVSAQTVHLFCEAGVPVVHLSRGHRFYGITSGIHLRNAYNRAAQYAAAGDASRQLLFARAIVAAKDQNQRTLPRRNATPRPTRALDDISRLLQSLEGGTRSWGSRARSLRATSASSA